MLKLSLNEKLDVNKFQINEYNSSTYNIKYNNSSFLIEPKIAFSNSSYLMQQVHKVRINLDLKNINHKKFKLLINKIYTGVNNCISNEEGLEDLSLLNIIHPINSSKTLENTEVIYLSINKNTQFYDYETDILLTADNLNNKRFDIYPLIYSPSLNIKNGNIYLNFSLRQAYIRITQENNIENKIQINKDDLDNAFNFLS